MEPPPPPYVSDDEVPIPPCSAQQLLHAKRMKASPVDSTVKKAKKSRVEVSPCPQDISMMTSADNTPEGKNIFVDSSGEDDDSEDDENVAMEVSYGKRVRVQDQECRGTDLAGDEQEN